MKLFVWDFHGTLERGNERAVIEISNQVLSSEGYSKRFSGTDIALLYGKKWYEYFEYLLPEQEHQVHLQLQQSCFDFPSVEDMIMKYTRPNDHVHEVLDKIAAKHSQILISNSNPEALPRFVKSIGVTPYFPPEKAFAIQAHAKDPKITKKDVLDNYVKDQNFDGIVCIGDSPTDNLGGIFYLYAHPGWKFREGDAHYKIRDLREVLREI